MALISSNESTSLRTNDYQLFEPGENCNAVLPVTSSKDEITFIRFLSLTTLDNGKPQAVVIPRDTVNANVVSILKELNVPLDFENEEVIKQIKGGVPLKDRWRPINTPPAPIVVPQEISISDPYGFIAKPTFEHAGKPYTAIPEPGNLEELLHAGQTSLTATDEDGNKILTRLNWVNPPTQVGQSTTFLVDDISEFLADPKISAGGVVSKITLTDGNVKDLLSEGVTKIRVADSESGYDVTVTTESALRSFSRGTKVPAPIELDHPTPTRDIESTLSQLDRVLTRSGLHSYPLVLYLPYRQSWELLGYTRGDILNSLSLGPEEQTTIEVFTWDRRTRSREEQVTSERESRRELSFTDKDSVETVKEVLWSENWDTEVGGSVIIPDTPITIDASSAFSEELKSTNRATVQQVTETVRKAAASIKTTRQTKVSETHETGIEERVLRTIKNPNLCSTLNLDYFEILTNYRVTTALQKEQIRLCVLVPNPIRDPVNRHFLINHEGVLRDALLSRSFEEGFEAAKTIAAWEKLCWVKCRPPCNCSQIKIGKFTGILDRIQANRLIKRTLLSPLITTKGSASESTDEATQPSELLNATNNLLNSLVLLSGAGLGTFCSSKCYAADLGMATSKTKRKCKKANAEFHRWLYWQYATKRNSSMEPAAEALIAAADGEQDGKPAFVTEQAARNALGQFIGQTDRNLEEKLLDLLTLQLKVYIEYLEQVYTNPLCLPRMLLHIGIDDVNLANNIQAARIALDASVVLDGAPGGDEGQQPPEENEEPLEVEYTDKEIAEALVAEKALINHILLHESYYRAVIWKSLSTQDRFRAMSLAGNLPDFVENEVLGFIGNQVVMPYRLGNDTDLTEWFGENLENSDIEVDDDNVSSTNLTLPTKGVMVESRLGKCDACEEYILETRRLDLRRQQAEVNKAIEESKQEALETDRYRKRLEQSPPILDNPESE